MSSDAQEGLQVGEQESNKDEGKLFEEYKPFWLIE